VLDTSKWSINTASFTETVGTPMVVVTNQRCEITCRGHLTTVADYDPAAPGGLLINGTWTFVNEGYNPDTPWIVTRSSGVPVQPWGEISDGVNFQIYVGSPGTMDLSGTGGATVTGLNVVSNTLNLAQGDSVNFTITDDGTNLSFFVAKIGDPTQAASATAICTNHLAANKISFYNTQFSYDTAALDNVVVQTLNPIITLTNIVVSPASPVIGVGSNQQFTATGYYSDGSVHTLTNNLVWSSSNGTVATISTNGLAAGLTAGSTTIWAISGSVSNSTSLTVAALGVAAPQNLFATCPNNGSIVQITPDGTPHTFATGLVSPSGITFDRAGNLFVSDIGNGSSGAGIIYKYTNGVAAAKGTFATGLFYPGGLAFDSAGNLFEADMASGKIYKFTNGVATARGTFASGLGPQGPFGLAMNSADVLFVGDLGNDAGNPNANIVDITPGDVTSVFLPSGLYSPESLAFDRTGDLFVTDYNQHAIFEFTNGVATAKGLFSNSGMNIPVGLAFDNSGNLYVADLGNSQIYEYTNGVASKRALFANMASAPDFLAVAPYPIITLTNIVVSPASASIGIGSNQQFTATGYYSDGSSQVLTNTSGAGSWTAIAGMPGAKGGPACAAVNGQLYVVSGFTGDNAVFAYNPIANGWISKAVFPGNYAYAGAAGIGTKLYVFGGCQNADCTFTGNELYIYDVLANSWTAGANMPLARSQMAVGVINGKIYAAGGGLGSSVTSQTELQVYDPASNTWTNGKAMPFARENSGAAVINGKLYVVGGLSGSTTLNSLLVYDPATDNWITNSSMPTPRAYLGAAAVNGLLYAIDGENVPGANTNLVEVYNPATDSWSTGAPTLTAHNLAVPAVINGTIYLAGGGPSNTAITNAEAYSPQTLLWSSSNGSVAPIATSGVATGLTGGTTAITASSGSVTSSAAVVTVVTAPKHPGIVLIAGGDDFSLYGNNAGNLWAMGDNYAGQLGDGTDNNIITVPELIVSGAGTALAAGNNHTLVIKNGGSLWTMGDNTYGQLGDGTYNQTNRPELIVSSNVTAVAAGFFHSLFVKSDGSLWSMGDNSFGQLGDGSTSNTNRPELIVASGVTAVSAGYRHSLFLKSDGSLWGIGGNNYGQLGDGTGNNATVPEQLLASNVTAIAAGGLHSLFIKNDGSLWAMGDNEDGELGDGTINYETNAPEMIVPSGVTAIAAGFYHSLFLKSDGSLWSMGLNNYGQLGGGTFDPTNQPQLIVSNNVTAIAAGFYHSLYIKSDGSLWAMGFNEYGELGDGQLNNTNRPEQLVAGAVANAGQPFFTAPLLTNGIFQAALHGTPANSYVVYVSSNLVNWVTLETVMIPAAGSTNVTDPAGGLQPRFYRARLGP
jgi:alpha-tubulin suppressor-like RCC1 family protein/sugar lactone lactonase YvrE